MQTMYHKWIDRQNKNQNVGYWLNISTLSVNNWWINGNKKYKTLNKINKTKKWATN